MTSHQKKRHQGFYLLFAFVLLFPRVSKSGDDSLCSGVHAQASSDATFEIITNRYLNALRIMAFSPQRPLLEIKFRSQCAAIARRSLSTSELAVAEAFNDLVFAFHSLNPRDALPKDFLSLLLNFSWSIKDLQSMKIAMEANDTAKAVDRLKQITMQARLMARLHAAGSQSVMASPAFGHKNKSKPPSTIKLTTVSGEVELNTLESLGGLPFNGGREWRQAEMMPSLRRARAGSPFWFESVAAAQLNAEGEKFLGIGEINNLLFSSVARTDSTIQTADFVSVLPGNGSEVAKVRIREVKFSLTWSSMTKASKQLVNSLLRIKELEPAIVVDTCELVVVDNPANRNFFNEKFTAEVINATRNRFIVKNKEGVPYFIYALGEEIPFTIRFIELPQLDN